MCAVQLMDGGLLSCWSQPSYITEHMSCVKIEVDNLGSPFLRVHAVFADIKQY